MEWMRLCWKRSFRPTTGDSGIGLPHDFPDRLIVGVDVPLCDLIVPDNGFPGRRNLPVVFFWELSVDGVSPTGASREQNDLCAAQDIFVLNRVVGKPAERAGPPFTEVLDAAEFVPQAIDEEVIGSQ